MPRLLVLSIASINHPHRKPYDVLAAQPGWEVHLGAAERIPVGAGRFKECDPPEPGARYHLHTLPVRWQGDGRATHFRGLAELVRRIRPDVIFAEFDPGSLAILQSYLVSRSVHTKVIAFTVDNIVVDRLADAIAGARRLDFERAGRDLVALLLGLAGRRATAAVACLNPDAMRIHRDTFGYRGPMSLVPLGTDTALFKPMDGSALRASLGLSDTFVIGYFGRLVPEKAVHSIIDALAELPPNARLLLDVFANFAPGSYAAELMSRAERLGVKDRIVAIDVPHGEVAKHMNACDVVVLPSIESGKFKEQYGRVLPEAMACGVPVIAARSGNLPVIVGDAGLVIEPGSAGAIRDAIRSLMDDPGRRADLGARGRRRVDERWSVDVQVAELRNLIEPLLEGRA